MNMDAAKIFRRAAEARRRVERARTCINDGLHPECAFVGLSKMRDAEVARPLSKENFGQWAPDPHRWNRIVALILVAWSIHALIPFGGNKVEHARRRLRKGADRHAEAYRRMREAEAAAHVLGETPAVAHALERARSDELRARDAAEKRKVAFETALAEFCDLWQADMDSRYSPGAIDRVKRMFERAVATMARKEREWADAKK